MVTDKVIEMMKSKQEELVNLAVEISAQDTLFVDIFSNHRFESIVGWEGFIDAIYEEYKNRTYGRENTEHATE